MTSFHSFSSEEPEERKRYSAPSLAELGTVAALTLGDGTSAIWDMGAGRKEE